MNHLANSPQPSPAEGPAVVYDNVRDTKVGPSPWDRRSIGLEAARYGGTLLFCLVLVIFVFRLWRADWRVPLGYTGDSVLTQMWIKGIMERGWYLENPALGAPGGQKMYDFPMADGLHFLGLKVLGWVSPNAACAFNLYYLLSFPLVALSALWTLRRLDVSFPAAFLASLLFTFLPFHFMRMPHIFLAAYYLIPPVTLLLVRLVQGWPVIRRPGPMPFFGWTLLCLLVGSAGVYYGFFSCFFLFLAGLAGSWRLGNKQPFLGGLSGIALIGVGVAINISPSVLYHATHRANSEAVDRDASQVDLYGLRLSQMVLPLTDHRLPALAELKEKYNREFNPKLNETDTTTLGMMGSLGMLGLLVRLMRMPKFTPQPSPSDILARLATAAFLLAMLGGGGALFGFLVTPLIRAYNRIAIFLAFFSFLHLAFMVEAAGRFAGNRFPWLKRLTWAGILAVLGFGVWDQTRASFIPHHARLAREFFQDEAFVAEVEARTPEGSWIFQMPYMPFPESWPLHEIRDYDLGKPYLHSTKLRWSYGAMKGRESDAFHRRLKETPLEETLLTLVFRDAGGVLVDRAGYADHAVALEHQLIEWLGTAPLVSENERYSFYTLADFRERVVGGYPDLTLLEELLTHPIGITWKKGFYLPEGFSAENSWRWCMPRGEIYLTNPSAYSRRVVLRMTLDAFNPEPVSLQVSSPMDERTVKVSQQGQEIDMPMTLPPGKTILRLACDGPPAASSHDRRVMVFRVINFTCREDTAFPEP